MAIRGTIVMHKYEIGRLLGQGTSAKVYHARDINNGQSVAIKVIDKEKIMKAGLMEQIKREISVMRLVRHPSIVHLFEVLASRSKIYVVMEYVRGGDLFGKIEKGRIPEDDARKYFQQLVSAIDYCHSRGVYHRDLKPENILLDENDNVKVTDFGLSALVDSRRQDILLRTTCGTPAYVAPEVIHCIGYDGAKADIWSSGVILFVLMAGQYPFHDSNLMELYRKIGRGEFKCPSWFSSRARKLISKILDPDSSMRISIPEIRETKWFKKGLEDRKMRIEEQSKDIVPLNVAVFNDSESNAADEKEDMIQTMNLNAFDIISLSAGFDLSGLFEDNNLRKEAWFISTKSSAAIISKLQGMAQCLKLKVKKKDGGILKMQALQEGRNGCLAIDFEIFEGSSSFYLVGLKFSSGDTSEYHKLFEEGIKPALSDIVCAWQSDMQYKP